MGATASLDTYIGKGCDPVRWGLEVLSLGMLVKHSTLLFVQMLRVLSHSCVQNHDLLALSEWSSISRLIAGCRTCQRACRSASRMGSSVLVIWSILELWFVLPQVHSILREFPLVWYSLQSLPHKLQLSLQFYGLQTLNDWDQVLVVWSKILKSPDSLVIVGFGGGAWCLCSFFVTVSLYLVQYDQDLESLWWCLYSTCRISCRPNVSGMDVELCNVSRLFVACFSFPCLPYLRGSSCLLSWHLCFLFPSSLESCSDLFRHVLATFPVGASNLFWVQVECFQSGLYMMPDLIEILDKNSSSLPPLRGRSQGRPLGDFLDFWVFWLWSCTRAGWCGGVLWSLVKCRCLWAEWV